jgi:hypothetical protein
MAEKDQNKQKTYAILFAFLILLTFVSINNQQTPSGEFSLETYEETLILSCSDALIPNLVDDLSKITDCTGGKEIALGQPFSVGGFIYTVEFQSCTPEQKTEFNTLYQQFC